MFNSIQFTEKEAAFLEKSTRGQSSSSLWYNHRLGRITASMFARVAKYGQITYPTALVKSIMQYTNPSPAIPALKWGRNNEHRAKKEYSKMMEADHIDFSILCSGLWLNTDYPHLGATPDALVSCSCCGEGLLEVKCPYKYKVADPATVKDKNFCLQPNGKGKLQLQKDHNYYYQVQGQLVVCKKPYCDFVCWTTKGIG